MHNGQVWGLIWTKNLDRELTNIDQDGVLPSGEEEREGSSVTFSNVQPGDAGVYICTAQDDTKTVHKTVQVRKVSLVKNKVHFKAKKKFSWPCPNIIYYFTFQHANLSIF